MASPGVINSLTLASPRGSPSPPIQVSIKYRRQCREGYTLLLLAGGVGGGAVVRRVLRQRGLVGMTHHNPVIYKSHPLTSPALEVKSSVQLGIAYTVEEQNCTWRGERE